MNKRWMTILLLVSFAFNLAVLGSFIFIKIYFGRMGCPPPPPPEGKRGGFMPPPLWERMREDQEFRQIKDTLDVKRRLLMTELAKDPIDEAKIESILSETFTAQAAFEKKMSVELLKLRREMSPEEAKEFFGKRAQGFRPPHFDRRDNNRKHFRRP